METSVTEFCGLQMGPEPEDEVRTPFGVVHCWRCRGQDGLDGLLLTVPPEGRPGFRKEDIAGFLASESGEAAELSADTAELVVMGFLHGIKAERLRASERPK